ncbi:MAG: hypothetical protein IJ699_01690 [Bacteroidaceae bacterium]|nr:hypothetical protein [Bacteroidaceae bacterium]
MPILQLHIVGFPYRKDIEGRVSEFLSDAPGRCMTVRVQRDNEWDGRAIRAFDWQGRHVGYVAKSDLSQAWGALQACGRRSLRGTVVSTNIEHSCAVFECMVSENYAPLPELYPQQPFLQWKYSGPLLDFPEELDALDYMMDEIEDRLAEWQEWDDDELQDFLLLLERFTRCSINDISGETDDYRRRLIGRLSQTGSEELEEPIEELKRISGRTGRETAGGSVLQFWMEAIMSEKLSRSLLVHQKHYDAEVIEEELKCFPDEMYSEWQCNRNHFVSKLYYKHIPREVLWRFVSGIAFVEMMKAREVEQKAAKEVAKNTEKQGDTFVIMTGTNAQYKEDLTPQE